MATFVLVHGAWHGGWCYRRVAEILRKRGHVVYTPTLTGLADRSHLLGPGVDLTTHIEDVCNLIRWEGLEDVTLVGHSYGGMVITGAADRVADRLSSLVYIDAFVPKDGQSLADLRPQPLKEGATQAPFPAAYFKVNEKDQEWVDRQMTPHPTATFTEKVKLTDAGDRVGRRIYIRAEAYPQPAFAATYERLRQDKAWSVHALPCGHDIMLDMPEELAALLEKSA